jgi:hypothetical protein
MLRTQMSYDAPDYKKGIHLAAGVISNLSA